MVILSSKTLRRFQSLAWITPEGGIIPIEGEDMHSDVAEFFPGVPSGYDYPTNYAMNKLGYMKVGNAFDFAYTSDMSTGADHSAQFDAMAQIVAQATINFMSVGLPSWFHLPLEIKGEPDRWIVHMVDTSESRVSKSRVKKFINDHGFDSTKKWFDDNMNKAEEAIIRKQVRMILSELRRRPV